MKAIASQPARPKGWNEPSPALDIPSMDELLAPVADVGESEAAKLLGLRELFRDNYWKRQDPIHEDRLLWRAQSFRHIVHLLPGQSILEIGAGECLFTRTLARVSRLENPITAVTFNPAAPAPDELPATVEHICPIAFPGPLRGRQFDFIVAMDLLDQRNCADVLRAAYDLLKPGGQVLFYESNPWNLVLRVRNALAKIFGRGDPRRLLSKPELYELISEIGFIRVFSVFNDFVYRPLTKQMSYVLRNLSILLENAPIVQTLAGSTLIHAQKPPRVVEKPAVSLCRHESLRDSVSVVIPCHNEAMNIGPLIAALKRHFDDYLYEIIPVDDNSKDETREVMQRLAVDDPRIKPVFRTPPNGVGRAITDGYRAATGKWILSMDCDFQHLLPEIRDLFHAAAKGCDVAVGSRFSRHSVLLNYPFQKIVANRAFHALAQLLFLTKFRDLTNNLKLMRREVYEQIELTQPGFSINAETGLLPKLMGFKVTEVPISWINRTPDMGVSSFKLFRVGGGYGQVLRKLWIKKITGRLPKARPIQ